MSKKAECFKPFTSKVFINHSTWLIIFFLTCFFTSITTGFANENSAEVYCSDYSKKDVPADKMTIKIQGDRVDISSVIETLEKYKKSQYPHPTLEELIDPSSECLGEDLSNLCQKTSSPESCFEEAKEQVLNTLDEIDTARADIPLYPNKYYPLGSAVGKMLADTKNLNLDCFEDCGYYQLPYVVLYGDSTQYDDFHDKMKRAHPACRKKFFNQLLSTLKTRTMPKQCLQQRFKNDPVCKEVLDYINAINGRMIDMAELAYDIDNIDDIVQIPDLVCVDRDAENNLVGTFEHLINWNDNLSQFIQCSTLGKGESKTISQPDNPIFTDNYILQKNADGNYTIPLNLKFTATENYDGTVPKNRVSGHYTNKVRACLAQANQKMTGPDGKKINILLRPASSQSQRQEDKCKPPGEQNIEIKVGPGKLRSSVKRYAADIDCPTITHEILHLLGLCDEYKEKVNGFYVNPQSGEVVSPNSIDKNKRSEYDFQLAYDCRLTSTNSIMSNHYERWNNVFENNADESLLNPGQFNSILYGGCKEKNEQFSNCSQLAYQSSTKDSGCLAKKRKCESLNVMGLNKQEEMDKWQREIAAKEGAMAKLQESPASNIRDNLLSQYQKEINELKKNLRIVQSWPDPPGSQVSSANEQNTDNLTIKEETTSTATDTQSKSTEQIPPQKKDEATSTPSLGIENTNNCDRCYNIPPSERQFCLSECRKTGGSSTPATTATPTPTPNPAPIPVTSESKKDSNNCDRCYHLAPSL
ncbi:MAG: hypothetical protein OXB84_07070, partial [Halobacteriovoraceae bacterium]|nr:hypothetical protein [Halobacteriovoraceae bacterium]